MPSKTIGLRDVLKVSWMQGLNEVECLSIANDDKVARVLEGIGFDLDYGISYFYANYRDLSGKVDYGYMVAGSLSINRKHLTSRYADLGDIMQAASMQDTSLAIELGELTGKQRSYDHLQSMEIENNQGRRTDLLAVDEQEFIAGWQNVEQKIKQMNDLVVQIRGSAYNDAGSLKTYEEYKQFAQEQINKGN